MLSSIHNVASPYSFAAPELPLRMVHPCHKICANRSPSHCPGMKYSLGCQTASQPVVRFSHLTHLRAIGGGAQGGEVPSSKSSLEPGPSTAAGTSTSASSLTSASSSSRYSSGGRSSSSSSSSSSEMKPSTASALSSLDALLGSKDSVSSLDSADDLAAYSSSRSQALASLDAGDMEVAGGGRPFFVYFMYYSYICVYLAHSWLVATEGDLSASALEAGLVNDHIRVLFGEVWRLITGAFYCNSPWPLFAALAGLATVGVEVEATFGPARFWALFYLATMTGGLADMALSEQPITFGPTDSIAGLVGALMGHIAAVVVAESRERASALSRGQDIVTEETEVEVALGVNIKLNLGQETRAAVNVLVGLVSGAEGLLDIGDSDASGSWIGLAAALWCGLALGFLVSPSRIPRKQQTRARSKRKLAMLEAMGIATQGLADAAEKEAKKAKKPARASSTGFIAAYTAILSVVLFGWLYEYGNVF